MKIIGAALAAALVVTAAEAKYYPPELFALAGASDLVVVGDIVKVSEKSFTLLVREVVAGHVEAAELEVVRFVDWTCSHRWKPYAVGQREIAFLGRLDGKQAANTGAQFGLLSAGAEAEWEIVGEEVSVQGARVPGGRVFDQGEFPGQWLPLSAVLDALRGYRTCFEVSGEDETLGARQLCRQRKLREYRRRSPFHEYLTETSLETPPPLPTQTPMKRLPPEALRP